MTKPVRLSLIALAIVIVLLVMAMLWLQSQWARNVLEDQLSQRLNDREVAIGSLQIDWGWPIDIRLEELSIANADWAEPQQMVRVAALELGIDPGQWLRGNAGVQRIAVEQPQVHLQRRADGVSNWTELQADDDSADSTLQPQRIRISQGRLTYRDAALDAELAVSLDTADEGPGKRHLVLRGEGSLRGKPLAFEAVGEPPAEALADEAPYALRLTGNLGEIELHFDGQAQDLPAVQALQGQLSLSAPASAELAQLPALEVPAFDLQAQVRHEGQRWALQDIRLQSGESRLTGSLALHLEKRPRIEARLQANELDLERWGILDLLTADEADEQPQPATQQSMAQRLETLRDYQGLVELEIGQLRYGDQALREVQLRAQLDAGRLEISQLQAAHGDGELDLQGWLEVQGEAVNGALDAQVSQLDLGQALQPLGHGELGTLGGELHARFDDDVLRIRDTQLSYDAPAQALSLQLSAQSVGQTPDLQVQGDGSLHGEPLRFDLRLGPLLDLRDSAQPYPVSGTLSAADTRAQIDGTLAQPLELGGLDVQIEIEGSDPARLNPLTGLDLPSLPAYRLEGRLRREEQLLRLTGLDAEVGKTDVSGDLRLQLGARPMFWATLHSRQLELDDLLSLLERTPQVDASDEPTSVFSDVPFPFEALRDVDAEVHYRAGSVISKGIPLDDVRLDLGLDQALLALEPLRIGLGNGEVIARLRLDVSAPSADGELDLTANRVNLKPLLRSADLPEVAEDSAGVIGGKADLRFRGRSLDELMAGLDGNLQLAMSGGRLDLLAVQLLGLHVGGALVTALAKSEEVPLQCAYARFEAEQGLVRLEQFLISTAETDFTAGGTINLDTERLDLALEAHPVGVDILSIDSPVELQGQLGNPQVKVLSAGVIARGVASLLGALIAPPLAILPWLEGLGDEGIPGCRQVLERFGQNADAPAGE